MTNSAELIFKPIKAPAHSPVELVLSGADYFDRLEQIIDNASNTIHLQTYIYQYDATGKRIVEAILRAALRNVKIQILLDAYGSSSFPQKTVNEFEAKGIAIRFFAPLFSIHNLYLGRRLHHKVIIADGAIAMLGGINIADKYNSVNNNIPWLDYAIQINEAKSCEYLLQICEAYYHKKKRFKRKWLALSQPQNEIKIILNDWLKRKNEISKSYIAAINKAKKEIVIVGSYFLPGNKLTTAIKMAAKRGVKIKIILSGISDVAFAKSAGNYLYTSFLKSNIELYEWHQSVVHGKAAVIDGEWTTIGSFNLNHLSSYGSIELNATVKSKTVSELFLNRLNLVIAQCEQITIAEFKNRNGFFTKINNWLVYHFVRLAFIAVTYLTFKRFLKKYIRE